MSGLTLDNIIQRAGRRFSVALATAVLGALVSTALAALPAAPTQAAAPASPIVQVNSGAGNGVAFTASLRKSPHAGNSIVIVTGLDAAATVGALDADDSANVIDMAESYTAFGVPGAPYVITWGAKADPLVKAWGFHGIAQPAAWLVVEVSGVQTFESGVPIWDNPAAGSRHLVTGVDLQMSSGHNQATTVPHEVIFAGFVARMANGTVPPTVTAFGNTFAQPGTWTRLGASVTSTNIRLDVALKVATVTGFYDCLATWSAAPSGMAGSMIPLYGV